MAIEKCRLAQVPQPDMNALKKLAVEGVFPMREGVLRRPAIAIRPHCFAA